MKIYITPTCCTSVKQERAIAIEVRDLKVVPWVPSWRLVLNSTYDRHLSWDEIHRLPAIPKFCQYCGTALPGIEPRVGITVPVWRGNDDYCYTCDERNMNCSCLPPWATFQPAGGDDLDVNKLWQMSEQMRKAL